MIHFVPFPFSTEKKISLIEIAFYLIPIK
jgi:hypothetical protein